MYWNSISYKQIMKKWKYFYLNDSNKETVGVVLAESPGEAFGAACKVKQLPLEEFKKLFGVERLWMKNLRELKI